MYVRETLMRTIVKIARLVETVEWEMAKGVGSGNGCTVGGTRVRRLLC